MRSERSAAFDRPRIKPRSKERSTSLRTIGERSKTTSDDACFPQRKPSASKKP
ncbi:hypothetical protein HALLA_11235 [Halostagnicola larsenii XH-48]|uniref:Uncharacterized protein n=1 Tax=Halostagnicola larsenii XH-48 TaxID=797299 RepID=W0JUG8_9EURY|nr:hypothetical protein HALLA_11235 [Halostagnicola larsenii XH-48]